MMHGQVHGTSGKSVTLNRRLHHVSSPRDPLDYGLYCLQYQLSLPLHCLWDQPYFTRRETDLPDTPNPKKEGKESSALKRNYALEGI